MFALGAGLFLVSDSTLIYDHLSDRKKERRKCSWILMLTYYAAQSLIALSLQFVG